MSWADRHIHELKAGRSVTFRPKGHSMAPLIKSGEQVTVEPLADHASIFFQSYPEAAAFVRGVQFVNTLSAPMLPSISARAHTVAYGYQFAGAYVLHKFPTVFLLMTNCRSFGTIRA